MCYSTGDRTVKTALSVWHWVAKHESPRCMCGGGRYSQAEGVPTGGVAGRGVPTHQRRLRLLYLHRSFVKLCCLLKVALLVAICTGIKRPKTVTRHLELNFMLMECDRSCCTSAQPGFLGFRQPVGGSAPSYPHTLWGLVHKEVTRRCASSAEDKDRFSQLLTHLMLIITQWFIPVEQNYTSLKQAWWTLLPAGSRSQPGWPELWPHWGVWGQNFFPWFPETVRTMGRPFPAFPVHKTHAHTFITVSQPIKKQERWAAH